MRSAITALMIAACLTSCSTAHFEKLSCPPVRVFSQDEQRAAAAELRACAEYAPADFCREIFSMLGDYHVLRQQSLACRRAYGAYRL
jgi:hypothetical protein